MVGLLLEMITMQKINVGTSGHIDHNSLTSLQKFELWNPYSLAPFKQTAWTTWQYRDIELAEKNARIEVLEKTLRNLVEVAERMQLNLQKLGQ